MKQVLADIFSLMAAAFAFVLLFVFLQTHHIWGNVHIEQILINLNEGVDLVPDKLILGYVFAAALGVVSAVAFSVLIKTNKRLVALSALICVFVLWRIGVFSYFLNKKIYSDIYEKEYINPESLTYTFPQEKRNIIVIYLESIEANYATQLESNLIAHISDLAHNNLSFEGFHQLAYQDYTLAAMVESMCAVPFRGSKLKGYEGYENFLASLVCYGEILQKNGYETVFMKGADINFARTGLFMSTHGFKKAMGANELNQNFSYPLKENTGGFSGYHDAALYKMIKEELTTLSQSGKPFFLSFITLDTHEPDYFLSPGCAGSPQNKEDVVRCTDKMLFDFIKWLKEQPFYEKTTVVVMGDHTQTGINRLYPKLQERQVVNFILNPSPDFEKAEHTAWTTLDVAPTVLNAAGISFSGGKFGLGRSLFAKEKNLYEKYGHKLETELLKSSHVYDAFETVQNKKEPEYHVYAPLGRIVSDPEDIEYFATYGKNIFGVVFLEELSFELEPQERDLILTVTFKSMLPKSKKRTVRVVANGKKTATWQISAEDKQPVTRMAVISKESIKDGKLLVVFDSDEVAALTDGLGIGVSSFLFKPFNEKKE